MASRNTSIYEHSNSQFEFEVFTHRKGWKISFEVKSDVVNTRCLPQTLEIIKAQMPGVLKTECFNEHGHTFATELQQTEIAHLFEHFLIYLMRETQLQAGEFDAIYEGVTSWNWVKNPRGTFTIEIEGPLLSIATLRKLIEESAELTEEIMNSENELDVVKSPTNLLMRLADESLQSLVVPQPMPAIVNG
jgi:hypothetical protein